MEEDHENSPGSHNEDELTSLPKGTFFSDSSDYFQAHSGNTA